MTAPHTCRTCRFWSQWLASLGDCMEYAERRQRAQADFAGTDAEFETRWPHRNARCTTAVDTCAAHEAEPGKGGRP